MWGFQFLENPGFSITSGPIPLSWVLSFSCWLSWPLAVFLGFPIRASSSLIFSRLPCLLTCWVGQSTLWCWFLQLPLFMWNSDLHFPFFIPPYLGAVCAYTLASLKFQWCPFFYFCQLSLSQGVLSLCTLSETYTLWLSSATRATLLMIFWPDTYGTTPALPQR